MALTQEQIKGLNAASARIASGAANDVDIKNVDYAKQKFGYTYQAPVSGTQGIQQVQQNQPQQTQAAALTPTQYNQIRTQNNVSPQNFDQYFERRGTDIYAKSQAPAQQTSIKEPVPNVNIPDVIPQQDFERFNNSNDLGELKNQVTNAIKQNQLEKQQGILNQLQNLGTFNSAGAYNDLMTQQNVKQLQNQVLQYDGSIRMLEDDLRERFRGGDISESEFQAELARRAEPLLKARQSAVDRLGVAQTNVNQQFDMMKQDFESKLQTLRTNYELGRESIQDELSLFQTLSQIPEDMSFTLSDGTVLTGKKKLSASTEYITKDDGYGNTSIAFWDSNDVADALAEGRMPDVKTLTIPGFSSVSNEALNLQRQQMAAELGILTAEQADEALDLRKQLLNEASYRDMLDIDNGLQGVLSGLDQKNGFGDVAAINAFQRMVDPGATVREGDVGLLQSASSWLSRIAPDYVIDRLKKGDKLPEDVRAAMRKTALDLYEVHRTGYDEKIQPLREISDIKGIDFDKYVGTGLRGETDLSQSYNITKSYKNINDLVVENPQTRAKIEEMIKDGLSDDEILQVFNPDFNNDLSKSQNYIGLYKQITGYGSPLWKWGLDVDLEKGDPVYSPVSGTVSYVGENGGFGKQVKIKGDDGKEYWLSHLDGFNVKKGDKVTPKQKIAIGGNTGNVIPMGGGDGSHLDITVKDEKGNYITAKDVYKLLS